MINDYKVKVILIINDYKVNVTLYYKMGHLTDLSDLNERLSHVC